MTLRLLDKRWPIWGQTYYRRNFLNQNPYQTPIGSSPETTDFSRIVDFRPLLIRWEKYRLVYNAALIATTLLSLSVSLSKAVRPELWFVIFIGAIIANLLFMLGPSLDGYLQVAGLRHRGFGLFIFGCGTLLAVCLAAMTVAAV